MYPIEKNDSVYYKRYDLCKFEEDSILCGGKLEQTKNIIENNLDIIKKCNNTVVCQTSVHSTSGTILAYISKLYGLNCVVVVGGSNEKCLFTKNPMMKLANVFGADVRNVCGTGMSGPVLFRMREICKNENFFNAAYENNVEWAMYPIINEVQNIPDELDNLIIPVGSGVTMTAILRGVSVFKKKVKRIIGCHVGPDRRKYIDSIYSPLEYSPVQYEMQPLNTVYAKKAKCVLSNGLELDGTYEAKAHNWMMENLDIKNQKTLFWNVGKCPTEQEIDNFIEKNT